MRTPLLTSIAFVGLITASLAQEDDFSVLSSRLNLVTDEALTTSISGNAAVAVGSGDCVVSREDVALFDAALVVGDDVGADIIAKHAPYGFPELRGSEQALYQTDYVIGYSQTLKQPVLAAYVLHPADIVPRTREDCFREDSRLEGSHRSTLSDYAEPIFDRGHLVPRADMNRTREAMVNTFLLSNMMPQHDNFNQGVWETLESAVRAWTLDLGSITVLTGPVFDKDGNAARDDDATADRVRPDENVAIPTGFYKVLLHQQESGYIDALAVLMPHTDSEVPKSLSSEQKLAYIQDHIVSIDEIEAVTGMDFLSALPEAKEAAIERAIAAGLWY